MLSRWQAIASNPPKVIGARNLSSTLSCSIPTNEACITLQELVSMCWHAALHACHCGLVRVSTGLQLPLVEYLYSVSFAIPNSHKVSDSIVVLSGTVQFSNPSERTNSSLSHITPGELCFQFHYESGAVPPPASRPWASDELPVFRDSRLFAIKPSTALL